MIIATHWTLIIWVEINTLQVLQQAKKAPDAWSQHETTHKKKTTKKCSFRVSWWRFLGRGGVKTPLETPASEANLDLLESPIPLRQDHSQTIWSTIVLSLMIMPATMVQNDPAVVKLWLDHGQTNHCQPYTFNGTNLTMVDHKQNYQGWDFVNRVWSWRQWPCIILKRQQQQTIV